MTLNDKEKAAQFCVRHSSGFYGLSTTDQIQTGGDPIICSESFYRTQYKNAYRDSSYEQIGALGGFLVPFLYLKQKKYAELHQWSTAILGGLVGFSFAAHVGITVSVSLPAFPIENGRRSP